MASPSLKVGSNFQTKDILIGVVIGAVFIGFILYAIFGLHERTGAHGVRGIIKEKEFIERPEERITIGRDGIHVREREGDFIFHVYVESEDKMYYVRVNRFYYESKEVGEPFYFARTPREEE